MFDHLKSKNKQTGITSRRFAIADYQKRRFLVARVTSSSGMSSWFMEDHLFSI